MLNRDDLRVQWFGNTPLSRERRESYPTEQGKLPLGSSGQRQAPEYTPSPRLRRVHL
jgi:hypothetical protein